MASTEQVINQTKKWIIDVVVGCNFCPFATNVLKQQKVHYRVEPSASLTLCLGAFLEEAIRLDNEPGIETAFIIFPNSLQQFDDYLDMLSLAENLLEQNRYRGIYQVASFHPLYRFENSLENDAANYTNRSVYPMLHLLREESIDKALAYYKSPDNIPERNIKFAQEKGLLYMKMLRDACLETETG